MTDPLINNFDGTDSPAQGDRPFDVVIKSTGAVILVGATQTVLEALQASGVLVPTSCQQGWYGTCLTGVLRVLEQRSLGGLFALDEFLGRLSELAIRIP